MQLTPLIVMALSIGTLVSLAFTGLRDHHFLPSFIFVSVFVLGIGLLIKHFTERPQT
jgi:FtsH-binding integral membrane protein